ncbi:hypothetical protein Tco_0534110 [Tanacetum coccineum]
MAQLTRKTYSSSSNNSFGLVLIASPTLLLFHDDPYMKVTHAYYAKESPIPPPTIVPPSSTLSGTDIQKESQKRPNQARDGKDKVKSKPKSVKVKSQPHEENTT